MAGYKRGIQQLPSLGNLQNLQQNAQKNPQAHNSQPMDKQSKQLDLPPDKRASLPLLKKIKLNQKSNRKQAYQQFMRLSSSLADKESSSVVDKQKLINRLLDQSIYYSQKTFSQKVKIKNASFSDNNEIVILTVCYGFFQAQISILLANEQNETHYYDEIGQGGFGHIYSGQFQGKKIVVKCIKFKEQHFIQILEAVLKEYLLNRIADCLQSGPSLIHNYFDLIIYSECIQFFQQKCLNIQERKLNSEKLRDDLCVGLQKQHNVHLIHFDIKTQNICFSTWRNKYVLIDYGLSKVVSEELGFLTITGFRGSVNYCSPDMFELYDHQQYLEGAIDVYYNDAHGLNQVIGQLQSLEKGLVLQDSQNSSVSNSDLKYVISQDYLPTYKREKPRDIFERHWFRVIVYYLFVKTSFFNGIYQMIVRQNKLLWMLSTNQFIQQNIQKVLALIGQNKVKKVNQAFFAVCFKYLTSQQECRYNFRSFHNQSYLKTIENNQQNTEKKQSKAQTFKLIQQHYLRGVTIDNLSIDQLVYSSYSLDYLLKGKGWLEKQEQRNLYLLQLSFSMRINNNQYSYEQRLAIANSAIDHYLISCGKFQCTISTCLQWLFNLRMNDHLIRSIILFNLVQSVIILELIGQQQLQQIFHSIFNLNITHLRKLKLIIKFLGSIYWIRQKISTQYSFYLLEQVFINGLIQFRQKLKQDIVLVPYMNLLFNVLLYRLNNQNSNFFQFFYSLTSTPQGHIIPELYNQKQLPLTQTKELLRQIQRYLGYIHYDYLRYSKRTGQIKFHQQFRLYQSLGELEPFPPFQQFTFGHIIQAHYLIMAGEHSQVQHVSVIFTTIFQKYQQYDNLLIRWELLSARDRILREKDVGKRLENLRNIKKLLDVCPASKKIIVFGILKTYIDILLSSYSRKYEKQCKEIMQLDQQTFKAIFYFNIYQQNNKRTEFHLHSLHETIRLISTSFLAMLRIKHNKKSIWQFEQSQIEEFNHYRDYLLREIHSFSCLECKQRAFVQIYSFVHFVLRFNKEGQMLLQLIVQSTVYFLRQKLTNHIIENMYLLYDCIHSFPQICQKYDFSVFVVSTIELIPKDSRQNLIEKDRMDMLLSSIMQDSIQQGARFIELFASIVQDFPAQNNIRTFYSVVYNIFQQTIHRKYQKVLELTMLIKSIKFYPIILIFQVLISLLAVASKEISQTLLKKTALLLNTADRETKTIVFGGYFKRYLLLFEVKSIRQKIYIQRKHLKFSMKPVRNKIFKLLIDSRKYKSSKSYNIFRYILKSLKRFKAFL